VAAQLGVREQSVSRWRARFVERRLDGLSDEPRPGRPPSILLDQVQDVVVATLESTPAKDTHWSRASMASAPGCRSRRSCWIWKEFDLKPHQRDTFKLSTDPQFVAKVVDVVGLYHHPPEKAVVLCVDEKSQILALDRSQPVLPMMAGMPERRIHAYLRHGIAKDDRGDYLPVSSAMLAFRCRRDRPLEQRPQVFRRQPFDKRSSHHLRVLQDLTN
jgi:hypothetical protein